MRRSVSNISVEITFEHIFSGLDYSLSAVECVFWDSVDRCWCHDVIMSCFVVTCCYIVM